MGPPSFLDPRYSARSSFGGLLAVFLVALITVLPYAAAEMPGLAGPVATLGVNEGNALAAASRLAAGEQLYRDVFQPHAPAHDYLLGALARAGARSVLAARLPSLLSVAVIAAVLYLFGLWAGAGRLWAASAALLVPWLFFPSLPAASAFWPAVALGLLALVAARAPLEEPADRWPPPGVGAPDGEREVDDQLVEVLDRPWISSRTPALVCGLLAAGSALFQETVGLAVAAGLCTTWLTDAEARRDGRLLRFLLGFFVVTGGCAVGLWSNGALMAAIRDFLGAQIGADRPARVGYGSGALAASLDWQRAGGIGGFFGSVAPAAVVVLLPAGLLAALLLAWHRLSAVPRAATLIAAVAIVPTLAGLLPGDLAHLGALGALGLPPLLLVAGGLCGRGPATGVRALLLSTVMIGLGSQGARLWRGRTLRPVGQERTLAVRVGATLLERLTDPGERVAVLPEGGWSSYLAERPTAIRYQALPFDAPARGSLLRKAAAELAERRPALIDVAPAFFARLEELAPALGRAYVFDGAYYVRDDGAQSLVRARYRLDQGELELDADPARQAAATDGRSVGPDGRASADRAAPADGAAPANRPPTRIRGRLFSGGRVEPVEGSLRGDRLHLCWPATGPWEPPGRRGRARTHLVGRLSPDGVSAFRYEAGRLLPVRMVRIGPSGG